MALDSRCSWRALCGVAGLIGLIAFVPACTGPREGTGMIVSLVGDADAGPPVRHGLEKVSQALTARGVTVERAASPEAARGDVLIVAGLADGNGPAAKLHQTRGIARPEAAEALQISRIELAGKKALLVTGTDDRGAMYALLDVADRVGWGEGPHDPLAEVAETREAPATAERALSKYTMHRAHFESTFHDEAYWGRYFDTLARNRFNSFVLIFGYENGGYFAPPYPYFFDTDGFAEIAVVGYTPARQQKNLHSLKRMIALAHDRGLNVTLGFWDHIYRGGVQGRKDHAENRTEGLVWGLTRENLVPYSKAALAKFLALVPEVDALQFRMHGESGLKRDEMATFWPDIYRIVKQARGDIRFDARAKNFPDSLIDKALDAGLNIRMCTKYWAEQMGLPFHPTHIPRQNQFDRRHGYADMLRYPRKYKMHWRMWTGGTTRILLWGDPAYARRFAESTHLYDGEGFEVNEPLATKMQDHPHDETPFELLGSEYRYYDWEFERYWHYFQVFGRLGYNPDTPEEVWGREFQRRFGKAAGPYVQRALHRASGILPRITASVFPYSSFPTTRGWAARQPRGDLPAYADAGVGDTQQFATIAASAKAWVAGGESAKITPAANGRWFDRAADDVLKLADEAEQRIGDRRNKEFDATLADVRILAHLARFHAWRLQAGMGWALYEQTGDVNALGDAIQNEAHAIGAWEKLVAAAGERYHGDLKMGRARAGLSGHWRDELAELKRGRDELKRQWTEFKPDRPEAAPEIAHVPIRKAPPGRDLPVRATVSAKGDLTGVRVGYRADGGKWTHVEMTPARPFAHQAVIPGAKVVEGLQYVIEATDAAGRKGTFPADGKGVAVTVTTDDSPPTVTHRPITTAPAGKPLTIAADVADASGVKWVRLRYRGVNQHFDYETLPMTPTGDGGRYEAVVPAEKIDPQWDFMYLIEVMDTKGNGAIHPDLDKRTPYVVVKLQRPPAK